MKILLASLALAALVPLPADAARVAGVQEAMVLDLNACFKPVWPAQALAQRAQGKTTLELRIGADGKVTESRVAQSSGRADLDAAALAGIGRCSFHAVVTAGHAPTDLLKMQYVWVPGGGPVTEEDRRDFATLQRAAQAGEPSAQNMLGAYYQHGTHVARDMAQAAAWYRRAAEAGFAIAQNNLGVLYVKGKGVPQDRTLAVYWYAKAAEQGHGWAQANLAWAYQHGQGIEQDAAKADYWLVKAAESGLADAQVRLGLRSMALAGDDAAREAAAAWLARAAAQDHAPGLYYLGRTFELGLGNAQDDVQAAALYRQALGRSGGRAETALGILLEAGRGGADATAAEDLYRKAIGDRYPAAFYRYGLLLEGRGDDKLAEGAFRQGAELGDCDAIARELALRGAPAEPDGREAARQAQRDWCAIRASGPSWL